MYSNETKMESDMNARVKSAYVKTELNRSLRGGVENQKTENIEENYMVVKENPQNPLTTEALYNDGKMHSWNDRAKRLGKELNTYSSRDSIESSSKANVQEKLRLLINNSKRNSFVHESEEDDTYRYNKKRGSSLQRKQENDKSKIVDEAYQRRSFNNNLNGQLYDPQRTSTDTSKPNLIMNTILKENIKT